MEQKVCGSDLDKAAFLIKIPWLFKKPFVIKIVTSTEEECNCCVKEFVVF
jgi:hypothetical protein